MLNEPPIRSLDDGHLSPLDFVAIQDNLRDVLGGLSSGLNDAQRSLDATPGEGLIAHPMLFNAYEDLEAIPAMQSLDLLRVVSAHDHTVIGGLECIAGPASIYFDASTLDDDAELDPTSGSYGLRHGIARNVRIRARVHGINPSADPLKVHYVGVGSTFWEFYDSNGDTWTAINTVGELGADHGQTFTPSAAREVSHISVYLKRSAGTFQARVRLSLWTVDGNHFPAVQLGTAERECGAISTSGEWIDFYFSPTVQLSAATEYAFLLRIIETDDEGADIYWYRDAAGATYAGGAYLAPAGDSWTYETGSDCYFRVRVIAAGWSTFEIDPDSYQGWQETCNNIGVQMRLAHNFYVADNLADFYVYVPEGLALNALCLYDMQSFGECHWRCGHIRTPHIPVIRSWAAADGYVLTADGYGEAAWEEAGGGGISDEATVSATETVTIASTTPTQLDSMSITITVPESGNVLLHFDVNTSPTQYRIVRFRFYKNGVALGEFQQVSSQASEEIFEVHLHLLLTNVSAGDHTYDVYWWGATTHTMTAYQRRLTALTWN